MKNVLITGASRGLGNAIAKQLASEGYSIHGTYNTASGEVLEQLKKDIPGVTLYKVDLSKRTETLALIDQLKSISLYGIVNNAGQYIPEDFKHYDIKTWDKVIELNVTSILLLASQLQENMEEGGAIVSLSSIYGAVFGGSSAVSYATSKATVASLTKALANMYGYKKVRAVAVAPGMVETDMSRSNGQAVLDAIANNTPLKRIGQPQEIANIVSFLISDKASYINGATIIADGGYSCSD
jgi:3-oxoacyl-[acyl-carrier protein] reductase